MRTINSASPSPSPSPTPTPTSGVRLWKSPIPYLFGGLALMMALISVALVILICSYRKHASQSSAEDEDFKQAMPKNTEINDSEPKILVIMAGDDKPTYLAKPITPLTYCTCEDEPIIPSSSSSSEQRFAN